MECLRSLTSIQLYKTPLGQKSQAALENAIRQCPSILTISYSGDDEIDMSRIDALLAANRWVLVTGRRSAISFSSVFVSTKTPPSIYLGHSDSRVLLDFFGPDDGELFLSFTHRTLREHIGAPTLLIQRKSDFDSQWQINNDEERRESWFVPPSRSADGTLASDTHVLKHVLHPSEKFITERIKLLPDEDFDSGIRNTLILTTFGDPRRQLHYDPSYEIQDIQLLNEAGVPYDGAVEHVATGGSFLDKFLSSYVGGKREKSAGGMRSPIGEKGTTRAEGLS